jgi:penicillin-binding protein 1A
MRQMRAGLRWTLRGVAVAGAAAALFAAGFVGYCAFTLPLEGGMPKVPTSPAITFTLGGGQVFAARGAFKGDPVVLDQAPPDLLHAVIAIEDRRFYAHGAIDWHGILRAAWHDLRSEGTVEGASTITQQLVRMTYLSPERTLRRKVQEIMLAWWLEARLSKNEILTRYLNTAYFGAGAYGVDAAAQRYFGKKADALDLAQSAMLAGLIRAPSQLAPTRDLKAARSRADAVLSAMVAAGYIDKAQAASARAHPATLAAPPETEPGQNYFVDTAQTELATLIGSPPMDLSAETTLDPRLQDAAERVVEQWLAGEGAKRHGSQAALVALAPDGAVLALVGGRDYTQSQFNRAVQARRQPGSLFKLFVYLAAFNSGYTPDSVVVDQPVSIGDWQPKNYEPGYRGPVTLRTAFAQSINTVSVQLTQAVGVDHVIDMAKSLGIHTDLPAVPSLALGSADVTLYDMTAAVDAIAIDTKSIRPYTIRSIRSGTGAQLYRHPQTVVEKPDWNRDALVKLMEGVVNSGTGRAARLEDTSVAGKTGTSEDYRDAWFIGFTKDLVVGVWVGNDDNSPMDGVVGGDLPAKIWRDFVERAEPIISTPVATEGTSAPMPQGASPASVPAQPPALLRGVPTVADTATLVFHDGTAHLKGVEGEKGEFAGELDRYIGGREVVCQPAGPEPAQYQCRINNIDLAEAVLLNGAGRATQDASKRLLTAEHDAMSAGRGLWRE